VGTTSIAVPGSPTNVVASGATGTSLDVSWSAPTSDGGATITEYVVQARLASASSWFLSARTNSALTTFKVTGLTALTSYEFKVAAINSVGTGTYSDVSSAASTVVGAPDAPMDLDASDATSSSLNVSWFAPSANGGAAITDYVVQYRLASESSWSTFSHAVSSATSITVTGLAAASSYVFQVAAVNSEGTGDYSDPSNAVSTLAAASTAPGMPTGVSASGATSSSLVVSWSAPVSDGGSAITDYLVQYRLASANSWTTFMHAVSASTFITVTGLAASSSYVFKVSAVNLIGTGINTDPSSPVSTLAAAVLNAPGAPGKPVIGARTTTSVAISWTAAAANGSAITNYIVEYRKGTGTWTTFTRADSTALSVTVNGLTKGGSYTFRVSAVSAGGTSPTSVVSAAALAAAAPGAPGSLAGKTTKVAGQIKVTWKAGSLNGAPSATYKVSWLVGAKWTTPVTATGFAYTITKLKPGTYSVKVTATTSQGSASTTKAGIVLKK